MNVFIHEKIKPLSGWTWLASPVRVFYWVCQWPVQYCMCETSPANCNDEHWSGNGKMPWHCGSYLVGPPNVESPLHNPYLSIPALSYRTTPLISERYPSWASSNTAFAFCHTCLLKSGKPVLASMAFPKFSKTCWIAGTRTLGRGNGASYNEAWISDQHLIKWGLENCGKYL